MELRDFVARSLADIIGGVSDAQAQMGGSGARVNPNLHNVFSKTGAGGAVVGWSQDPGGVPVLLVEFDVAVTTTEGSSLKAGIGVIGGLMSVGARGESDDSLSSASRIKFSVPIALPANAPAT